MHNFLKSGTDAKRQKLTLYNVRNLKYEEEENTKMLVIYLLAK